MFKSLRGIIIFLSFVLLLIPSISMAEGLTDIDQSIYKIEIEKLIEDGIIDGFPDGTYRPEDSISRAEFAKVLATSLKLDTSISSDIKFEDVKGKWHEGYISAVFNNGLMIGKSDTSFAPDANITREELSLILVRAFGLLDVAEKADLDITFVDQKDISPWAEKAVMLVYNIGLLEGIEGDNGISFLPKELGDRQLVAKLVYELQYNKEIYDEKIQELNLEQDLEAEPVNTETDINDVNAKPEDNIQPEKNEQSTQKDLDEIISKYTEELESLQGEVESQLDDLVSQAQDEYNKGESLRTLYNKYENLARDLESETDDEVESILSDMEKELDENGYDKSAASDLYDEYESIKKGREIEFTL